MSFAKPKKPGASAGLYLRSDGALMLARGDQSIELHLSGRELLALGLDAIQLTLILEPELFGQVIDALLQPPT